MSDTPDSGFTLDFIGRMLMTMRDEQRAMNQRLDRFEADTSRRFEEARRDTLDLKERFTRFEVAQIRLEDRMRSVDDGIREAVRHLRADQRH